MTVFSILEINGAHAHSLFGTRSTTLNHLTEKVEQIVFLSNNDSMLWALMERLYARMGSNEIEMEIGMA